MSRQQLFILKSNLPALLSEQSISRITTSSPSLETMIGLIRQAATSREEADRIIAAMVAKSYEEKFKGAV